MPKMPELPISIIVKNDTNLTGKLAAELEFLALIEVLVPTMRKLGCRKDDALRRIRSETIAIWDKEFWPRPNPPSDYTPQPGDYVAARLLGNPNEVRQGILRSAANGVSRIVNDRAAYDCYADGMVVVPDSTIRDPAVKDFIIKCRGG
jgi:hypothetical protein